MDVQSLGFQCTMYSNRGVGSYLWPINCFACSVLGTFCSQHILSVDLTFVCVLSTPGHQVIEEQRRRLAELKQKAAVEAQCQWEALHGSPTQFNSPFSSTSGPVVHHSILHHTAPSSGEQPYDTLSLESSDSMDTSISTGNNSACSPDNMSRFDISLCFPQSLSLST